MDYTQQAPGATFVHSILPNHEDRHGLDSRTYEEEWVICHMYNEQSIPLESARAKFATYHANTRMPFYWSLGEHTGYKWTGRQYGGDVQHPPSLKSHSFTTSNSLVV